jgi:hypothetical protein
MRHPLAIALLTLVGTAGLGAPAAGQGLVSLTLASWSVTGGENLTGTVSLDAPAPAGGIIIHLTSSSPAVAKMQGGVTIPSGATSRTFRIKTTPVSANLNVVPPGVRVEIAARGPRPVGPRGPAGPLRSVVLRRTLYVVPPLVQVLFFFPPLHGGDPVSGVVSLNGPSPADETRVWLKSADPTLVNVPDYITVPKDAMGAFVPATTNGVAATTPVEISAQRGPFVIKTATIHLLRAALDRIEISPSSVTGGTSASGGVFLLGEVAGPSIAVALSSTDSGVASPQPSSLSIPASENSAPFTVVTDAVAAPTTVTIRGVYAGVTKEATLEVVPAALATLTVTPGTIQGGAGGPNQNGISKGRVTLNGPAPSGGAAVSLAVVKIDCPLPQEQVPTVPGSTTVIGNGVGDFDVQTYALAVECRIRVKATLGTCLEATLKVTPANQGSQPSAVGTPCAG